MKMRLVALFVLLLSGIAAAQTPDPKANADKADISDLQKQIKSIRDDLKVADADPTFALSLGIGSLVLANGVTDYSNNSNVLQANNLGRATPQYLVGVSMHSEIPNFGWPSRNPYGLKETTLEAKTRKLREKEEKDKACTLEVKPARCQLWRRQPWGGFVSLKFSPTSSQTINGFVIGGSYSITSHLNALIGFALSPINEAAPGFRVAASQFVAAQQIQGQYLNFEPVAMLNNSQNAFDGFSVTDASNKLIYKGNPTDVHYRGGVAFGISIPVTFSSFLKTK